MDYKTIERAVSTLETLGADLGFINSEFTPDDTREAFKRKQELNLSVFYIKHAALSLKNILKLEGGSDEQKI